MIETTMQRSSALVLLLVLVTLTFAAPIRAESIRCAAEPTSGPPGTAFGVTCAGLGENAIATAYVVEPSGAILTAGQLPGFVSNIDNGSILTDENGTATFTWQSGGGLVGPEDQTGSWTWVVHEVNADGTELVQGQVTVELVADPTSVPIPSGTAEGEILGSVAPPAGTITPSLVATGTLTSTAGVPTTAAHLTVVPPLADSSIAPPSGSTFNFAGAGFLPGDIVNLGVVPPSQCAPRAPQDGSDSGAPLLPGASDTFSGPGSVQADNAGRISFSLVFAPRACPGVYSVLARSSSGRVAGSIDIRADHDSATASPTLSVTPDSVTALAPFLTLLGSGFDASSEIGCSAVGPGGAVFPLGSAVVDASGNFAVGSPGSDLEPGIWYARCETPDGGKQATASFMVASLTTDP